MDVRNMVLSGTLSVSLDLRMLDVVFVIESVLKV